MRERDWGARRGRRVAILTLAAVCLQAVFLPAALCAQDSYKISDDEKTLSKSESSSLERMIDYELAFYNKVFGPGSVSRDSMKMTVVKDYVSYAFYLHNAGIKVPQGSGGVYSSKTNELVVWRGDKNRDGFLATCYHEMSHALLRSKMKSPPVWINEGLATWFENMRVSSSSVRPQSNRYYEDRVKTLIEINDLDLKDFIAWDQSKFRQASFSQDGYGYAVAYCMISLLFKNNEEALLGIIRELAAGTSSAAAFDACYPGGLETFEKEFIAAYS